jgi:uncharacterized protein YkwD
MKIWLRASRVLLIAASTLLPIFAHAATLIPSFTNGVFESNLITLTNSDRVTQGVAVLEPSSLLNAAAQKKADDMMAKSYFAHYSPEGVSPWHWFTSVGYYYTHPGENLAMDFATPTSVESAWMASPEHRANILRGVYTQIGVGMATGIYNGQQTTFVVELFATPATTKNPA